MSTGNRVAIVGVGYSTIGRRTGLTPGQLTTQCVQAALDDAGMTVADIDGYSTMGGEAMADAWMLGITPINYFFNPAGGPAFVYPAIHAISAIASGLAHTVIATRIIQQQPSSSAMASGTAPPRRASTGDGQFTAPFGLLSPTQNIAGFLARRHMVQFGTTEEQFGAHVATQREWASMNDDAFFHDRLTVEDYLNSRYISKPVRLLDCDYPCDSGSAVIFTTEERARNWRKKPVFIETHALSAVQDGFDLLHDQAQSSPWHCARELWSRTDLTPADVDCAQLYDGFTIITFQWLEALGFCAAGEAGPFVEAGNTRPGGSMPVNTDGGACNVGRRHGANFCIEGVRQLRGESGRRQVPDAKVTVWTNAVGPFAGAVLMTAD